MKTESISRDEWNWRVNSLLTKLHLMRKDWETDTEYQIKLANYRLDREQKELDKLRDSHSELTAITNQLEKEMNR